MLGLFYYIYFMRFEQIHQLFLSSNGVSTDTRNINEGTLFFALKGDNFNGNKYANQAIKKGASYALVDESKYNTSSNTILVDNVLKTLQDLASYHRNYLKLPIIALTGSNGKTTTKELINAVLSKKYNTVATKGNLNNHIGVPLTILSMTKDTEIGIVEMGANHLKEIELLSSIAQPDYGYITNFGKAHLEGFGSIEGVIKGKSELYDYLLNKKKYVFLNADDAIQKNKLASYIKKFGFSQSDKDFYEIKMVNANPFVKISIKNTIINSKLVGDYNFTNIAAAILIGKYFNVDIKDIKNAVENYIPSNNRSQIINKSSNQIILDAYNANPSSIAVALKNFNSQSKSPKIAVLGDMFELGKNSKQEHQSIVNLIENLELDRVFLIGENFYITESNKKHIVAFKSFDDFRKEFEKENLNQALILIKGSRGMALERTLDLF